MSLTVLLLIKNEPNSYLAKKTLFWYYFNSLFFSLLIICVNKTKTKTTTLDFLPLGMLLVNVSPCYVVNAWETQFYFNKS